MVPKLPLRTSLRQCLTCVISFHLHDGRVDGKAGLRERKKLVPVTQPTGDRAKDVPTPWTESDAPVLPCALACGGGLPGWFLSGLAALRARRPIPPHLPVCVGGSWHVRCVGQPKQLSALGGGRLITGPRRSLGCDGDCLKRLPRAMARNRTPSTPFPGRGGRREGQGSHLGPGEGIFCQRKILDKS